MEKLFTREEIAAHCSYDDCWIILGDSVYDVTKFAEMHPGGFEIVFDYAGQDATEAFENVGHSACSRMMLTKFFVGRLVDEDRFGMISQYISYAKGLITATTM